MSATVTEVIWWQNRRLQMRAMVSADGWTTGMEVSTPVSDERRDELLAIFCEHVGCLRLRRVDGKPARLRRVEE